jgi:hypothetical protein
MHRVMRQIRVNFDTVGTRLAICERAFGYELL